MAFRSITRGCCYYGSITRIATSRGSRIRLGLVNHVSRLLSSSATNATSLCDKDPELVDVSSAPADFESPSAVVYPAIVTPEEERTLVDELEVKMRRRRYERDHWDAVINRYKEVELQEDSLSSRATRNLFERVRGHLLSHHFPAAAAESVVWLPCHAIDLHADGELNAHVDSIRFSGNTVAGLSLLSGSIMRLFKANDEPQDGDDSGDGGGGDITEGDHVGSAPSRARAPVRDERAGACQYVDLYLPPRSLYVLSGTSRYDYTHELLPTGSLFRGEITVERDRRLSVIFRDAKA